MPPSRTSHIIQTPGGPTVPIPVPLVLPAGAISYVECEFTSGVTMASGVLTVVPVASIRSQVGTAVTLNPGTFTWTVNLTGLYLVTVSGTWTGGTAPTQTYIDLFKNGSSVVEGMSSQLNVGGTGPVTSAFSNQRALGSGTTYQLRVSQTSAGSNTFNLVHITLTRLADGSPGS